jgi:HD-GYP domain-containing protein (c-di-GMP phosphodiesterase class II)
VKAIKQVLLQSANVDMILAQDVVDDHGRVLITSGIALTQEILRLLAKREVTSIWIQNTQISNNEIHQPQSLINATTQLKLMYSVQNSFYCKESIVGHLSYLQQQVEDIVNDLKLRRDVLIYLNDVCYKSDYLFMHSVNVGLFSIAIGIAMDLPQEMLCLLGMGGLLHDFGKTRVSREILDKQGRLSTEEFNVVKEHSAIGYNLLKAEPIVDHRIMLVALQHHERCDGSGYPWGILEHEIHPLAKIVAVADVYDALTTDRVYRGRMPTYKAIEIINAGKSLHFDNEVITAFNKIAVPYNVGTEVKLDNGLFGTVVRLNSADLFRPTIYTMQGIVDLLHEIDINIVVAS